MFRVFFREEDVLGIFVVFVCFEYFKYLVLVLWGFVFVFVSYLVLRLSGFL